MKKIISKLLYRACVGCGNIVEKKFNKFTKDSYAVNQKVLFKILSDNSKSEIGLRYNFDNINSIKDFKNKVPLSDYSDYEEYIKRMAKGEKNILVTEDIEYFGHTSGTTGKQKLIPSTKSARRSGAKYMMFLNTKFSYNNFKEHFNYGRGLMIADTVTTTYTESKIPICSATSGGMRAIKNILPYLYTSPIEVMYIRDKEAALYLHLLFALKEVNLLFISGVFISNVLDLLRVLEDKHKSLADDIRRGRISKGINIDDDTREKLNKYLSPSAGRAIKLESEFIKGFESICRRIWPSLTYIACVTGANFSIYDDKVNYYTNSLPIYSPAYAATEGMIGINPDAFKIRYVVIPDTVFYEFIPIEEAENINPKTYCINELKLDQKYEVVLTNHAGFYRYKLYDVVKVVDFYNNSPEIEFLYRKNQVLNMAAEKTTEEHLTSVIQNTMKRLNLKLVDYTTNADNSISPGRYIFYFEFRNEISPILIKALEKTLDEELRASNLAYGRFRKDKRLGMPKVVLLKKNTFEIIKESLFKKGISKNQVKIPRVILKNKSIFKIVDDNKIA